MLVWKVDGICVYVVNRLSAEKQWTRTYKQTYTQMHNAHTRAHGCCALHIVYCSKLPCSLHSIQMYVTCILRSGIVRCLQLFTAQTHMHPLLISMWCTEAWLFIWMELASWYGALRTVRIGLFELKLHILCAKLVCRLLQLLGELVSSCVCVYVCVYAADCTYTCTIMKWMWCAQHTAFWVCRIVRQAPAHAPTSTIHFESSKPEYKFWMQFWKRMTRCTAWYWYTFWVRIFSRVFSKCLCIGLTALCGGWITLDCQSSIPYVRWFLSIDKMVQELHVAPTV